MALDTNRQRILVSLTIFFSFAAIGLIVASFATDNWISANAIKTNNTNDNSTVNQNDGTKKFSANITFGLFRGRKLINYGFGAREQLLDVVCDSSAGFCFLNNRTKNPQEKLRILINNYNNPNSTVREEAYNFGLFSFGLWVATIICGALGIVWGLIHVAFAVFNVVAKPIETITGPFGLYVWNGLAFFFILLSTVTYLALYLRYFKNNVMTQGEFIAGYVSSAYFDFTYYFQVAASCCYLINFLLLLSANVNRAVRRKKEWKEKMDNNVILY